MACFSWKPSGHHQVTPAYNKYNDGKICG